MSLAFTRALTAEVGERPTSRQQRSLARAINDRLRGPTDGAWRVGWMTYNQARLVRNPDASGWLFPSEFEFWSLYAHLARADYRWPLAGPGEPEGANLGSVLPQFVFGNAVTFDEAERLSQLMPMRVNGKPPVTAADVWDLGIIQRGVQTEEGYQYAPALEAAESVFAFAFHPLVFHAKSYGGWQPTPQVLTYCGGPGSGYEYWPSYERFWTALSADVDTSSLHGTVTAVDGLPRVTYAGTCPCDSGGTAAGHILYSARYPFAWYLAVSTSGGCEYDVDRLPTSDWIEGPYDGAPSLAHGDPGHIVRAAAAYHSDFRGADSERTPDTFSIRSIAFGNQEFFTRQYPLAPARGIGDPNGLAAIYPSAEFTSSGTLPLRGENGPWTPHPGYVLAGWHARGSGLIGPVTVTLRDGSRTLGTIRLQPEEGEASASYWASPGAPSALSATVDGMPDGGRVTVSAAELVDYKPQLWDAYLVSRMGTAAGGE